MAVREVEYSKEFMARDKLSENFESESDLAIRVETLKRFRYRNTELGEHEGEDETQKYSFKFRTSQKKENEVYVSSVRIRKCGNGEVIKNFSDIEEFLMDRGFSIKKSK